MSRFFHKLTGSLLIAFLFPTANAAETDILDLHYGEVLFHFYQDDYFTSLSHLMAAQDKSQIRHHEKEAELLHGGLQLSYGMSNEADRKFRNILDSDIDSVTQNQVWYYLGKYAYQQGQFEKAQRYLEKINDSENAKERDEHVLLKANTLMMLDKNNEAANILAASIKSSYLHDYLVINKGIAQLRAGHISTGEKTLASISKKSFKEEELKALRDQANLGLGFQFIRQEKPEQALDYLHQVRLHGPFSQEALLATGWALAELNEYQEALTPWIELGQRDSFDSAVQEANLAIPYAFEKLENNALAIQYYTQAIDYFVKEHKILTSAVNEVKDGNWKDSVSSGNSTQFGNWLTGYNRLELVPAKQYLSDLLSGHSFQSSIGTYRDLLFLHDQLDKWSHTITTFNDMVSTRNDAYQRQVPATRERLENNEVQLLTDQLHSMEARYESIISTNNVMGLATENESDQWQTIKALEDRINKLPTTEKLIRQSEKIKWLKGILYWQVNDQFKQRSWSIRKSLNDITNKIQTGNAQHTKVATALDVAIDNFSAFYKKINAIEARIMTMKPILLDALSQSGRQLESLLLNQLKIRESRLTSYLTQARYSLARNHDLLSGELP